MGKLLAPLHWVNDVRTNYVATDVVTHLNANSSYPFYDCDCTVRVIITRWKQHPFCNRYHTCTEDNWLLNDVLRAVERKMHPLLWKAILRLGLFQAYVCFFAWVFTIIERRDESSQDRMGKMLTDLRTEINIKYNMTNDDFERFVRTATAAMSTGDELDWTFLNSGEFVFAALTTIGYGHITPKTPLGQGITIIVCIFGIPISMLALKTTGELVATCIKCLVRKTETALLKRAEPKHIKKKTFIAACALMAALLTLTGVSTTYLENWTFIEGLYAWYTTFTTIGFGDYVLFESLRRNVGKGKTSENKRIVRGIVFTVPYLVGLSLTSCILNCLVDSLDEIRDFRDRYVNCWPSFTSCIRRLLCYKDSSYDVTEGPNDVHKTSSGIT